MTGNQPELTIKTAEWWLHGISYTILPTLYMFENINTFQTIIYYIRNSILHDFECLELD